MGTRALKTLLLVLVIVWTLAALEDYANAARITWSETDCSNSSDEPDSYCNINSYGSIPTTEQSRTKAAAKLMYKNLFTVDNDPDEGYPYWYQEYCKGDSRYQRKVYWDIPDSEDNSRWKCRTRYEESDSGEGCSFNFDCTGHWYVQLVCGDNIKDSNEQCDPPSADSIQCHQNLTECVNPKMGMRLDTNGNCSSNCQCQNDTFTVVACIKDYCGAKCGYYSMSNYSVSGCENKCSGSTRQYNGTCNLQSTCTCSYQTENCSLKSKWYDTGDWTYYACKRCKPQEYREYSCTPNACTYAVSGTQQICEPINEGQVCQTDSSYSCNGICARGRRQYTCQAGECRQSNSWMDEQPCSPYTCSGGACTTSCSQSCNAECDSTDDCKDKCLGNVRYYSGSCSSQCTCSYSQEDCGTGATCVNGACMPKVSLSVSASFSPTSSIRVGETAILSGTVKCLNGNCGDVYVHAKNTSGTRINEVAGLSVQGDNPYICYGMISGVSCSPSWSIKGNSPGSHPIFLLATNNSGLSNQSSTITLTVNEITNGNILAELSLGSPVVTIGSATTVQTNVYCSGPEGAYCGNITSYLFYNGILMKSSGDLFTSSGNPQKPGSCIGLWAGGACSVSWSVNSSKVGTYNLSCTADSDRPGVENATSAAASLKVNEKPIGILKIEGLSLSQVQIKTGEAATLAANIKCMSSDGTSQVSCGTVKSYPRQNGTKITSTGPLSVQAPDKNCGTMDSLLTNLCQAQWDLTGNSLGSYAVDIVVYSDLPEVQNSTSESRMLDVVKNLGSLSIPRAETTPSVIKITNTTVFSATVSCSSSYCGSVSVQLRANGILLNSSTPVSTSQNLQPCSSFPCGLSWTLTGNSEGSFVINVTASSNESIWASNLTTERPLVVEGYSPLLTLSSTLPESAAAGQPVKISARVSCLVKDCGQVFLGLSYNTPSGWKTIGTSGEAYLTQSQQNPAEIASMLAGQSEERSWEVNFTNAGAYEIRISANGSAANIVNAEQKGTVNVAPPSKAKIEIMLPLSGGPAFMLGDFIQLKAKMTRDGKPAKGLYPVTATIPDLFTADLHDDGVHNDEGKDDGVYGGTAAVPPKKPMGQYRLIFNSGESEKWMYIYIDPALYVTIKTDRDSYTWGENITISGDVMKKGSGTPASMTMDIVLLRGNWNDEIKFNATGHYSYVYENRFMPNNDGDLRLEVTAEDVYGNSGHNSTEASVMALKTDSYSISFGMAKYNYSRGEAIPIIAKVYDMGAVQTGISVKCRFLGKEIELKEAGGSYQDYYNVLITAPLGEQSLSCSAIGQKPGSGQAKIKIEPIMLKIVIVKPQLSPQNVLSVTSGQTIEVKAAVLYPDNTPVKDAAIQVSVGGRTTNMTYTGVPGFYKADTIFSGAGMSVLLLQAQDEMGNYGQSNVTLAVDTGEFNWWWLLLIPAGIALFLVAWRLHKESEKEPPSIQIQEKIIRIPVRERVREIVYRPVRMPPPSKPRVSPAMKLRSEIKALEEKHRTIQNAKDLAEKQYYKRQIDEATFSKLMQDYEEKMIEIDAAIRQKRNDLQVLAGE